MTTRKKKTKKRVKKKASPPERYKDLWDKDYYELTERQRVDMFEAWVSHTQQYEWGKLDLPLDPPFYTTQREIIQKEEQRRREEGMIERVRKEAEHEKRAAEERQRQAQTQAKIDAKKFRWVNDAVIILNVEEKLKMQNAQLKLDVVDATLRELQAKIESLQERRVLLESAQEKLGDEIGEKYEIDLEQYEIDLGQGICKRFPHIKPPNFDE